jgi:hypothetical protein
MGREKGEYIMGTNKGVAKFIAKDPYAPLATREELNDLLSRMDGVIDWAINKDNEVAVEYEQDRINDEMIEDALIGLGLKLKHISEELDIPDAEARQVLEQDEGIG